MSKIVLIRLRRERGQEYWLIERFLLEKGEALNIVNLLHVSKGHKQSGSSQRKRQKALKPYLESFPLIDQKTLQVRWLGEEGEIKLSFQDQPVKPWWFWIDRVGLLKQISLMLHGIFKAGYREFGTERVCVRADIL